MPIDRCFRETWIDSHEQRGYHVWESESGVEGTILGTTAAVHIESCVACMKCITACPTNVFVAFENDVGREAVEPLNESECILCMACEIVCPVDAIDIDRQGGSEDTLDALLDR